MSLLQAEPQSTKSSIRTVTLAVLQELGWGFEPYEGRENVIYIRFQKDTDEWSCFVQIDEAYGELIFYSLAPFLVDENKHTLVMEYITRVNYGIRLGNFELDLADGELRYKTSLNTGGASLPSPLVQKLFTTNVGIFAKYLSGAREVMKRNKTPIEAFEEARDAR